MATRLALLFFACLVLLAGCARAPVDASRDSADSGEGATKVSSARLSLRPRSAPQHEPGSTGSTVVLEPGRRERIRIDRKSPRRKFIDEVTPYRLIELPRTYEKVVVRVQVIAQPAERGRGNNVIRPLLHVLEDDDSVRKSVRPEPLQLDIRPFKPTRLLGCVALENVRRFAVAADARAVGELHESHMRSAVKAPSAYGFHYATGSVKVYLPYASTGEMVIEVRALGKRAAAVGSASPGGC